jgi:S-DNA-T family DNA segregation ATPase FtsK/SpoIIIE
VLTEIYRRYDVLAQYKCKNIASYNDSMRQQQMARMPYIVVCIDEFADLILNSVDVEDTMIQIAQLGRAAGIHLILATQRPTVDVVTGLIKANIQTRICFKVADKVNSRVVLDSNGAEELLGKGDALIRQADNPDLLRIHGAFVDETEINRVVNFTADQISQQAA